MYSTTGNNHSKHLLSLWSSTGQFPAHLLTRNKKNHGVTEDKKCGTPTSSGNCGPGSHVRAAGRPRLPFSWLDARHCTLLTPGGSCLPSVIVPPMRPSPLPQLCMGISLARGLPPSLPPPHARAHASAQFFQVSVPRTSHAIPRGGASYRGLRPYHPLLGGQQRRLLPHSQLRRLGQCTLLRPQLQLEARSLPRCP